MGHAFFRGVRVVLTSALGYLLSVTLVPRLGYLPRDEVQMIGVALAAIIAVVVYKNT